MRYHVVTAARAARLRVRGTWTPPGFLTHERSDFTASGMEGNSSLCGTAAKGGIRDSNSQPIKKLNSERYIPYDPFIESA